MISAIVNIVLTFIGWLLGRNKADKSGFQRVRDVTEAEKKMPEGQDAIDNDPNNLDGPVRRKP